MEMVFLVVPGQGGQLEEQEKEVQSLLISKGGGGSAGRGEDGRERERGDSG